MKRAFHRETLEVVANLQREVGPMLDAALTKLDLMNALNEFKRQKAEVAKLEDARKLLEGAGYSVTHRPAIERSTPTEEKA